MKKARRFSVERSERRRHAGLAPTQRSQRLADSTCFSAAPPRGLRPRGQSQKAGVWKEPLRSPGRPGKGGGAGLVLRRRRAGKQAGIQIGRASCRERVSSPV